MSSSEVSYTEENVPLDDIATTAEEVVIGYGGRVFRKQKDRLEFRLPRRAGVAASGEIDCTVSWTHRTADAGSVTVTSGEEIMAPRPQRLALLVAGGIGAMLWILWPFFPHMGALAWTGGVIAIAVYLMTLRRSPEGVLFHFLQQIVHIQRTAEDEGEAGES